MPSSITIRPATAPVRGMIRPPGSKSITNRALVCAALADGPSVLTGALDSDDTRLMIAALSEVGFVVDVQDGGCTLHVEGTSGHIPSTEANLFVGNSGTTVRFLAAMLALGHGAFRLDGVKRMRERPIGDLLNALSLLGGNALSEQDNDCPPVVIHANGLPGGEATVRGDLSSQFLSGLLMAAPYARSPVKISIDGELVSQPYVKMTLAVMQDFGVKTVVDQAMTKFETTNDSGYVGKQYAIEPDASAASYFWAAAAMTGGEVSVEGLSDSSLQGDVAFCDCLEKMGCEVDRSNNAITVRGRPLHGIDVDMNAVSDTAQTLAAVALVAEGPTTIRNVAHIRHKETDRIGALAVELRKLGASVEERDDGLTITPGPLHGAVIETYDDHRMAMSLALVGLILPGVVILNPDCTAKTYPGYFTDLARISTG